MHALQVKVCVVVNVKLGTFLSAENIKQCTLILVLKSNVFKECFQRFYFEGFIYQAFPLT